MSTRGRIVRKLKTGLRRRWQVRHQLAWAVGTIILLGGSMTAAYFAANPLPDVHLVSSYKPIQSTKIYDMNDKLAAIVPGDEDRVVVRLSQISPVMISAMLGAEDHDFYVHHGIKADSIIRAALKNVHAGHVVEGASTITQQLVKNLFFPGKERSLETKLREALLAVQVERSYNKHQILEMYFNQIYFGNQSYGIERAAQRYFGKPASALNLAESAFLAGVVKCPSILGAPAHRNEAIERQHVVLDSMTEYGMIAKSQAESAKRAKLTFRKFVSPYQQYPFYVSYIVDLLKERYDDDTIRRGMSVYTNLDPVAQRAGERQLAIGIGAAPRGVEQGALVSLRVSDGAVRALVGGVGPFEDNQWNRAVSPHTMGSSFKPFVYLTGFLHGKKPTDIVLDAPIAFPSGGHMWSPRNFDGGFMGPMPIRKALALSRNVCAARVAAEVGIDAVIDTCRKAGITSDIPRYLPVSLGSAAASPLEMASAYATFARGGVRVDPQLIRRTVDCRGKVDKNFVSRPVKVFDSFAVSELLDCMQAVVTEGTGVRAKLEGRVVAGKTGTSDAAKDIWFVGFTPDTATATWGGNDSNMPIPGHAVTGGMIMAGIWKNYMDDYYVAHDTPSFAFAKPEPVPQVQGPPNPGVQTAGYRGGQIVHPFQPPPPPAPMTSPSPPPPPPAAADSESEPVTEKPARRKTTHQKPMQRKVSQAKATQAHTAQWKPIASPTDLVSRAEAAIAKANAEAAAAIAKAKEESRRALAESAKREAETKAAAAKQAADAAEARRVEEAAKSARYRSEMDALSKTKREVQDATAKAQLEIKSATKTSRELQLKLADAKKRFDAAAQARREAEAATVKMNATQAAIDKRKQEVEALLQTQARVLQDALTARAELQKEQVHLQETRAALQAETKVAAIKKAESEKSVAAKAKADAERAKLETEIANVMQQKNRAEADAAKARAEAARTLSSAANEAEKAKSDAQREAENKKAAAQREADQIIAAVKAEMNAQASRMKAETNAQASRVATDAKRAAETEVTSAKQQSQKLLADAKRAAETEVASAKAQSQKLLADAKRTAETEVASANQQSQKQLADARAQSGALSARANADFQRSEKSKAESIALLARLEKEKAAIDALRSASRDAIAAKRQADDGRNAARAETIALNRQIASLRATISGLDAAHKQVTQAKSNADADLQRTIKSLKAYQEQVKMAAAESNKFKTEATGVAQAKMRLQAELSGMQQQLSAVRSEHASLQMQKAKLDAIVAEARAKEEARAAAIRAEHERQLAAAKAKHDAELAAAKAKRDAELKAIAEAKAKRDAAIAAAKAKRDAELAAAKAKRERELAAEKAKRDAELAAAKAKRDAELAAAKAKRDAELAAAKAKRDAELKAIAEAKAKREAEIAAAKAKHDAEVAAANAKREAELRAKQKAEADLQRARREALAAERSAIIARGKLRKAQEEQARIGNGGSAVPASAQR